MDICFCTVKLLFQTTLSIVGKFGATCSFCIIFVYTAEMFPTEIRSTAVGSSSTCARIGGILAPQVNWNTEIQSIQNLTSFHLLGCQFIYCLDSFASTHNGRFRAYRRNYCVDKLARNSWETFTRNDGRCHGTWEKRLRLKLINCQIMAHFEMYYFSFVIFYTVKYICSNK